MGEIPRPPEEAEEEKIEQAPLPSLTIPEYIDTKDPLVNELSAAAREGDKNAKLFFAQLQLIESYPQKDERIFKTLQEVSRDAATSLYNLEKTPEEVRENLCTLAGMFNGSAEGRFSLQVPRIGSSIDRTYMCPRNASVKTVKKIFTWAVRPGGKIAAYQAEVE